MRRIFMYIIYGAFILIIISGCSSTKPASTEAKNTVNISASYPNYQNLDQLIERASYIIEGEIINSKFEMLDISQPPSDIADNQLNPNLTAPAPDPLPYTIYEVEVRKVYKGHVAEKETIQVKQLGGVGADKTYVLEDSKPIAKGKKYLMFLAAYDNSPASLLNPIQGAYDIEDNKIIPHARNQIKVETKDLLEIKEKNLKK